MSNALYNDAIIREAKAAASAARLPDPDVTVTCDNPLCGDRVTLDLRLDGPAVAEVGHKTRGCMLTQAAASVVARHAVGVTHEAARVLVRDLEAALRRADGPVGAAWPELEMFGPVRQVRSRHECVLLPFHALRDALEQASNKVVPT